MTESDLERFWAKVEVRGADECWEWTSTFNDTGYGRIGKGTKVYLAHRWAYLIEYGLDPDGKCVCHACDNPACCNPAHLWLGTRRDNSHDAVNKGRHTHGERDGMSRLTQQDVQEILMSDERHCDVARQYGVSPAAIGAIRRGDRWKHLPGDRSNPPRAQGARKKSAKLVKQDVIEILASNELHQVLAQRYGVSRSAISMVKSGRNLQGVVPSVHIPSQ